MSYAIENIRNICLLGHGGTGKTSLAESILFLKGATDRLGKIVDGNTVGDYDPEEIRRKISVSLSVMHVEHEKYKINILDTPGYFDFSGEVNEALRVADSGIIVCAAKSGISVGTEKAWLALEEEKKPRMFYISKVDEENGDFDKMFDALRAKYGSSVCPCNVPFKDDAGNLTGIYDILAKKAFSVDKGKAMEIAVPAGMTDKIKRYVDAVNESVAETSEEFMEKFFSGEEFTEDELFQGMRTGVKELTLFPVICGSAISGIGTLALVNTIIRLLPSPIDAKPETSEDGKTEIKADPNALASAFVFKTLSDQYGKFSFFKVISGKVSADMTLINSRTSTHEKVGHIYVMQGKKSVEVKEIDCGDIGAVSKLSDTKTCDTLCDPKRQAVLKGITFAKPCYSMAISPKVKGQEDKIAAGLTRLAEEDLTFSVLNNAETHQLVLSGAGDIHLDVLCSKLKSKFGVEVELSPARVPYREKIRKKVKVQGRHKKQSGGHGQFGDVWIEFEPGDTEDLVFEEKIFGGSVPKNFHPAVEKGLRDCIGEGVLAGYPVVYLKATLVDGSYHDVDSSEMAFKLAANAAYKAGLPIANPVMLEPIGMLNATIPDHYLGDIIGDLNKRRGRVLGMSPSTAGTQIVEAEVPMAEMSSYAIDLRSMTQGRGSFTFDFARYEDAPANIQAKIIEEAKALNAAKE
jgi:elongation factor G